MSRFDEAEGNAQDRTGGSAGHGRAALVHDDVEFVGSDATLLRTIAQTGSIAEAASDLGRSRARASWRIDALEEAFGPLVERQRGGDGGGGSQLTTEASALLDRFDRLSAALEATAQVPETVLSGTVREVAGELATVDTEIGEVQGLHEGLAAGDPVQVRIGADAVTIHDPTGTAEPDATSARNRQEGVVTGVNRGETVFTVSVDVENRQLSALVTEESETRLGLREGSEVVVSWKATATRLVEELGDR